jgi:D-alanine--poly(phosphoribitol) ligase subunit 1
MVMQRNVLEYLEGTVERFPDKVAIEDESGVVTFSELRQNALAISSYLLEQGLSGCQPVAVFMPKSIKAIEAFLGILYAGGFYVPLDTGNPQSRIDAILKNIQPKFVISENKYWHLLDGVSESVSFINLEQALGTSLSNTNYQKNIDTDPAYLINTSGSTGVPKGVVVSHRSVIDYIDWARDIYRVDSDFVIGNQAPFIFDNSVLDFYLMLATGAKLCLVPENLFMFPVRLVEYLKEKEITFIFWVPSIMSNVAKYDALNGIDISRLSHVLFAGEVMPTKVFIYWKNYLKNSLFSNLYGPTEITVDCTYIILERAYEINDELPIGVPCRNTNIIVLDDNNSLVTEPNALGELCVRGSSLAMGYYNDPEKTSQVFVQNPLNPHYPERIYRTGDMVSYNERGELMYKGRKDFQIKHMGYRIELGEIETAVLALDGIDKVCVLHDAENKNIVLVYESGAQKMQKDILLGLHGKLPKYMLPTRFELVKVMPLNMNGKIDRQRLKQEFIDV